MYYVLLLMKDYEIEVFVFELFNDGRVKYWFWPVFSQGKNRESHCEDYGEEGDPGALCIGG